jgi:hypothetical protein
MLGIAAVAGSATAIYYEVRGRLWGVALAGCFVGVQWTQLTHVKVLISLISPKTLLQF